MHGPCPLRYADSGDQDGRPPLRQGLHPCEDDVGLEPLNLALEESHRLS